MHRFDHPNQPFPIVNIVKANGFGYLPKKDIFSTVGPVLGPWKAGLLINILPTQHPVVPLYGHLWGNLITPSDPSHGSRA
ncbi:hypothetical protein ACHAQJ_009784 [Trichoderma viride]